MPDYRVDSIYDIASLQAEQEKFLSFLADSKSAILDLNNQRVTLKSTDVSSFTKASQDLNKAMDDSTASTTKATTANKELTKAQIEARLANQQRTAALKDEVLNSKAAEGSYNQLQLQLKSLTAQYKSLSELERSGPVGKQMEVDIATTNAQLKILDAGLGNYQRNVGNYNNSLGLLSKGIKGVGGLGILLSKALGIDPEVATAIEEVGRAIRELQHARELQEVGLEASAKLYELNTEKIDAQSAALTGETISTEGAAEANAALTTSIATTGVAEEGLAASAGAATVALGAEAGAAEVATVATNGFKSALIATGIGAALIAIIAAIYEIVKVVENYNLGLKSQVEAQEALKTSLAGLVSATKEYEDLRSATAAKEIKDLEDVITARKAAGVNALESLALDKQLATAQLQNADAQAKRYNINEATVKSSLKSSQDATHALLGEEQLKREFLEKTALLKDKYYEEDIKRFDTNIEQYKKEADAQKAAYEFANKIFEDGESAKDKINLLSVQETKLHADDRRALILAEAQIESEIVTSNNAKILSNERSTLDQRLSALKSNQAQQLAVIKATLNNTLTDPTKSDTEKNIAQQKANADRIKTNNDSAKAIFDVNETYRKKELKAENDFNNASLTRDKEISANKLTDRYTDLDANINLIEKSAADELKILTNNYELTKATTVLSEKELLALTEKYNSDVLKNNIDTDNKIVAAQQKAVDDQVAALKYLHDKKLGTQNDQSQTDTDSQATDLIDQSIIDKAGKNAAQRAKIEAKLQEQISVIDKKGQIDRLDIADNDLEQQKGLMEIMGEDTTDIEAKITANKRKEAELRKGITDDEVKYEEQKRNELLDTVLEGENQLLEITQAIGDGKFQREKDQAQKQADLIDAQTQKKIAAVNAEVASDQQKAAQIAIINARADAEKQALDLKQRKADHDKAKFDKEISILQIIAQIAIDIAEAKYGAAALAGAALIKLIATPIPAYKHGRGTGKDELAIVGDGGVNEYIMRGTGTIEKTPAVNTLTHLMPKDKVYKNKEALMKELMLNNMQLSDYSVSKDGGINKNDIERMTNRIEQAVNNIKVPPSTQITKEGWRMVNEKNLKYDQWVNRTIKN